MMTTPETDKALKATQGLFRAAAATNGFADHARKLEQQRDQLKAALEGMVEQFGFHRAHDGMVHDERMAITKAMDALAEGK